MMFTEMNEKMQQVKTGQHFGHKSDIKIVIDANTKQKTKTWKKQANTP